MTREQTKVCNYPECDGGAATGYCHSDCVTAMQPRLMGPRSPFWQCPCCDRLGQSPLFFPHADHCPARADL